MLWPDGERAIPTGGTVSGISLDPERFTNVRHGRSARITKPCSTSIHLVDEGCSVPTVNGITITKREAQASGRCAVELQTLRECGAVNFEPGLHRNRRAQLYFA